jgi:CHAT domain-containing protein
MVAFGNPPGAALPEAEREVAGLKARFPGRSRIYVGSQATKRALLAERSARYLHFATHGIVDERDPAASYLMLGGGNLTIEDTYDLPIRNAELAVLSACRTALGHSSQAGTEVGVFVEAFRHVARNVVATMWPVDDLGTRWFMDGFYSRIVQGEPPAAALAGAQRNLIRKPGLRHPFFWAPFVAYGHS